jgi:hypothetical protein
LDLYDRLSEILTLQPFRPIRRELLALDRLCRARNASDPFARLLWNVEAAETFLGVADGYDHEGPSDGKFSDVVASRVSRLGLEAKAVRVIQRDADRFSRLRHRPGFVSNHEASAAQAFAERLIMFMLHAPLEIAR